MQLVQLQQVLPAFEAAGYAIFAISYDRPADLGGFAERHGITYPLLSDEGSRVIRELGVLDRDLEAHHAAFGGSTKPEQLGVAYPMTFILDASGRVERKLVEENYRLREGGRLLLAQLTGPEPAQPRDTVEGRGREQHLAVRAWIDSPTYFAYQRLGLGVELTIPAGWHTYGPVALAGYQPLEITITSEPSGARVGAFPWPPTSTFRVAGIAEAFAAYEGSIRVAIPVELVIPRGTGDIRLAVEVRSQACSATECLPPSSVVTTLTIPEAPTPQ